MKKYPLIVSFIIFFAIGLNAQNPRNVILYNLTSTDCGPCSCMDSIVNARVTPEFPNTIVLALHSFVSAFYDYRGDSAFKFFNPRYEPSGFIDGLGYDVPFAFVRDSLAKRYARSPEAPVKIEFLSKEWDAANHKVNMQIKCTNIAADLPDSYWYNVVVTEGNLIRSHRTQEGCSKRDKPDMPLKEKYLNHNVVRKMEFWRRGAYLIGPSWPTNVEINRSVSVDIDEEWIPENCNIVVMVYKNDDSLYKAPIQQAIRQSVTGGLGLSDSKSVSDGILKIFPNPSAGQTFIHFAIARSGNCNLNVFDQSGRLVTNLFDHPVNPGNYNAELNTTGYLPGQYFCVLTTPSGKTTNSFLIK